MYNNYLGNFFNGLKAPVDVNIANFDDIKQYILLNEMHKNDEFNRNSNVSGSFFTSKNTFSKKFSDVSNHKWMYGFIHAMRFCLARGWSCSF